MKKRNSEKACVEVKERIRIRNNESEHQKHLYDIFTSTAVEQAAISIKPTYLASIYGSNSKIVRTAKEIVETKKFKVLQKEANHAILLKMKRDREVGLHGSERQYWDIANNVMDIIVHT